MIGNQQQAGDGFVTVATKVKPHEAELLNIIAQSKGTDIYGLLQLLIQSLFRAAKCETELSPDLQLIMHMIEIDSDWNRAFSFASPKAQTEVAQMVLILQQHDKEGAKGRPRKGFGVIMIDHPLMPGATPKCTRCVDDIMERVLEVTMPGIKKRIDELSERLDTKMLRNTLLTTLDRMLKETHDEADIEEMPQLGNYSDFGQTIEFAQRTKQKKHRTPDSMTYQPLRLVFVDEDREAADREAHRFDMPGYEDVIIHEGNTNEQSGVLHPDDEGYYNFVSSEEEGGTDDSR